jgi:hypothetical protein
MVTGGKATLKVRARYCRVAARAWTSKYRWLETVSL